MFGASDRRFLQIRRRRGRELVDQRLFAKDGCGPRSEEPAPFQVDSGHRLIGVLLAGCA